MRFLITGTAGFIGFHLARRLLDDGHSVVGFDGMTPYYDVSLKRRRHEILGTYPAFVAVEAMLEDAPSLRAAAEAAKADIIVHLAGQAGVRYSLEQPHAYASANLVGMVNVLELCREVKPKHFLFGSTSSVYGMSDKPEFVETDTTDRPVSLYAATKKSGEVMAHSYAHLFGIPTTVCRFFTVYGPYGRPDMSLFKFVKAILDDEPIDVFGNGVHERDFTYVGDLVEAVTRLAGCIPEIGRPVDAEGVVDTLSAIAPYREVNIAGGRTVGLIRYIETIEEILGKKARLNLLPMQAGDVMRTSGSAALLEALTGYQPETDIRAGMTRFVDWYVAEMHPSAGPAR
ncbi:NAD-dependent epimerase/dehydratase family protein [Mesorhizobium marinum]|uniref:NAD-dependent epimerase/dehydratase family protein n=1 Tax=Mesorhizobium marinum TaxID=3228790 RepID=A0ABV3QZQ5_9HYPH